MSLNDLLYGVPNSCSYSEQKVSYVLLAKPTLPFLTNMLHFKCIAFSSVGSNKNIMSAIWVRSFESVRFPDCTIFHNVSCT